MNEMIEKIVVQYPQVHSGASETQVRFLSGKPDLLAELHPGERATEGTETTNAVATQEGAETRGTEGGRRFFVTDATVATLPYVQPFAAAFDDGECKGDRLLIMGSGEAYKTIESVLTIIKEALKAGFTRHDTFVGIGGGVICDLTAFAASLFKRGARFEAVPTTLLAMVDAAIGGKTGCDFDTYKNMIGTFFPASVLYVWPMFVQSLPAEQYKSGLAECLKTAMLYDKELYALFASALDAPASASVALTGAFTAGASAVGGDADNAGETGAPSSTGGIMGRDGVTLDKIIRQCAKAKASVVESDFLERGDRMMLNFGHTFAHALESVAGLGIVPHGDAVAWGMGRAACLAHNMGVCPASYKKELLALLDAYGWETSAVPKLAPGGFAERMIEAMHKDKKNAGEKVRVILQRGLCDTVAMEVEDEAILAVLHS